MDEVIARPVIDTHRESYQQFFDHEWARHIFACVKSSPLQSAVKDLIVSWRLTCGVHILPWLMAAQFEAYLNGLHSGSLQWRESYCETVIKGVAQKVEGMMSSELNRKQRRSLKKAVEEIEKQAAFAVSHAASQCAISADEYWKSLIDKTEFRFSILGVQRTSYCSLFFSYEDFLASAIRTKCSTYDSKKQSIPDGLGKHLGNDLRDYCWASAEVELGRLVRNALVHDGGRFSQKLEKYESRFSPSTSEARIPLIGERFTVVNGQIQIVPCNSVHLFTTLKARVSRVVNEVH